MTGNNQQSPVSPVVNIPGYKILEVLGKGGMAIVYLAIQESIGRNVALKILAPDHTDDSFTDRFLREARIVSQLTHPNIITIYDAGVHQGYHYMCMEYIPGQNLTQARDTLNRTQKVGIIKQIALALEYAGKKGYVHRDIKPENIMLHEDGRAILTDFGIARGQDTTRGLTQTGKAIGTPYFMSPEQTKGLDVDHRSDIYSLGVVLFQAIAGHVPFDGPSIVAIGVKHISEPIPILPPGMEIFQSIINKCMSKEPAHRYQSAQGLFQALDQISDAQLDYIEAKAKAIRQVTPNHQAKTQLESASVELLADSHVRPSVKPGIPKMRAVRNSAPIEITDTEEYKRLVQRRRRWLPLLLLVTLGAVAYYQHDRLRLLWHSQLQPRLAPYLPASWRNAPNKQAPASVVKTPPVASPAVNQNPPPAQTAAQDVSVNTIIAALQENRRRLRLNPRDMRARQAIADARNMLRSKLEQDLNHKNADDAQQLLQTLRQHFPQTRRLPAIELIDQRIQRIEAFNSHMDQARVYMAANAIAAPVGANALEEYLAASHIDGNDPAVKAGLQNIAHYFYKKAKIAETKGNLVDAVNAVANGLQAIASDPQLLALKQQLANDAKQAQRIKQLIRQATTLMQKNQVIDPHGNNAYQLYRTVTRIAPHNQAANDGLQQVQLWLQNQIQTLYADKQYLKARKLVERARNDFPANSTFIPLQKKINQAIKATYPRISRIVFSASPVTDLADTGDLTTLAPGQTLYGGFAFRNFYQDTTRLMVQLKNGDGTSLYVKQVITVKGRNGQGDFALQLPKPGSQNGNYTVELYMNKVSILKARLTGLN